MHERRNFLVAASTTAFGVGFAGLIASLIALATVPQSFRHHWGWVPVVGIFFSIAAIVGSGVLAIAWNRMWQANRRRRIELGALAKQGRQLSFIQTDREGVRAWIIETAEWLETYLEDYAALFWMPEAATGRVLGDLDNMLSREIEALVASHLHRLAQIMVEM